MTNILLPSQTNHKVSISGANKNPLLLRIQVTIEIQPNINWIQLKENYV